MYQETVETPFGPLLVRADDAADTEIRRGDGGENRPNALTNQTVAQLKEYLAGSRTVFDLPLAPQGTSFQKSVWAELLKVPFGCSVSYGELAAHVGCGSARAIGQAVGRNPILIVIPCHRVLAANKKLGGFSAGLPVKEFLLNLEEISLHR